MAQKYKVGDKVRIKSLDWYNENKDEYEYIVCGKRLFYPLMSQYCGNIFTISDVYSDFYQMYENRLNWTDEMIEELVRDESKNTDDINRESYVKAESNKYFQEYMNSLCKEHDEMIEGLMKDGTIVDYVKESNNRYRIVIDPRFNIEVDEGEYYAVRRKKEYPKTFLECCDVLGIEDLISRGVNGYRSELLDAFQKLLICRDAYWKIAGEEMGLGKPWENGRCEAVYSICRDYDEIVKQDAYWGGALIFEFPTAEMRDAFYENFKELIEQCKELL